MSIAFVVLKLEGGSNRPLPGVTGSRNSPGEIGLIKVLTIQYKMGISLHLTVKSKNVVSTIESLRIAHNLLSTFEEIQIIPLWLSYITNVKKRSLKTAL